jgi:hypothetical protein
MTEVRWNVDVYDEWVAKEGLVPVTGLAVDLPRAETKPWARFGVDGALIHLDARGDYLNSYLLDVPPGGATSPVRHMYEAVVYVVDGRGSTVLTLTDGSTREFEWGKGSLFSLPLNTMYRHFNASGKNRARLYSVSTLPIMMKMFRNETFLFDTPFDFTERFSQENMLRGDGKFHEVREHRHQWETNLVPDLLTFDQMRMSPGRGAGSTNIQFVIGDGSIHAHESEIPVGNYKKAHIHGDGFHIIQLSGVGYSLYWFDGEEPTRVDWQYGLLHSPQSNMWHQHFNVSDEPARYAAMAFGSIRYPILREKRKVLDRDYRVGGSYQIEYADEDPSIRADFVAACEKFQAGKVAVTP